MICINLFFDASYCEAALVTAHQIHITAPPDWSIQLNYLFEQRPIRDAADLIANFAVLISQTRQIHSIGIDSNSINQISRYHFNNSVIFKALTPLFCNSDYPITIDAGFVAGDQIDLVYQDWLNGCIELNASQDTIMCVYTNNNHEEVSGPLRNLFVEPKIYPMGCVLGFSRQKYLSRDVPRRLLNNYGQYYTSLTWPEQDLLYITSGHDELLPLKRRDLLKIETLPVSSPVNDDVFELGKPFGLHKIAGSLKPWHSWVLNPKRKLYLKARQLLTGEFQQLESSFIQNHRHNQVIRHFAVGFLAEYERYLISHP